MACPETWSLRWALERIQTPYVAYLGADDELGETHLELHVQALQRHELSLSSVEFRVAGQRRMTLSAAPAHGSVDLNGIAHRTELRDLSTWQDSPDRCPDWELVRRWLAARVTWTTIPVVTAIHHDGWLAGTTPRRSLLASSR